MKKLTIKESRQVKGGLIWHEGQCSHSPLQPKPVLTTIPAIEPIQTTNPNPTNTPT